ncbi:hypothetical protein MKW98_015060 [Papaver atlanticum]|uniref:Uncharacterized protein n=1 Tax=Papaver atlanticum TaxID=357466 RepID=A0AAD4X8W9_9MAGN|nr:hypothetical protein MKW98_015060 [Papaver atlanticum]
MINVVGGGGIVLTMQNMQKKKDQSFSKALPPFLPLYDEETAYKVRFGLGCDYNLVLTKSPWSINEDRMLMEVYDPDKLPQEYEFKYADFTNWQLFGRHPRKSLPKRRNLLLRRKMSLFENVSLFKTTWSTAVHVKKHLRSEQ